MIPVQFEGVNLTLTALKTSYFEQLNRREQEAAAVLSTGFSRFKIDH
ncbi:hypothetical protein PPEP_a0422 [Pseudoalteromonas peptidolytica F12-50-A1]|uniref:Uncharacterized protein n=1 Tax=Pseudoalteromonas peptidolytica F12-50-A1 TaxID=1315280 RepID=A0A8I0T4U2_9GAMM|nr:hypothetical protein [Pseudoalteromonas peptidolytica F12-50-A1]